MTESLVTGRTYATFRIWGGNLNPENITSRLKLEPSIAFKRGDKRGRSATWQHGYWDICSKEAVVSTNLATHLEWLLDQLEPVQAELFALVSMDGDVNADILCFWESKKGHGGPVFSPLLLKRIASLNMQLGLDIYFDQ